MVNYIIVDTSIDVGGAETFNALFVRFLVGQESTKVIVLTVANGIIRKALSDLSDRVAYYDVPDATEYNVDVLHRTELETLGKQVLNTYCGDFFVLCSYLINLQLANYIFNSSNRVHILSGVLHPEAWSTWHPDTGYDGNRAFKPRVIDDYWYFQRDLLRVLDTQNSLWYPNDIFRRYNEYYFDIELQCKFLATVPVNLPHDVVPYRCNAESNCLKLLWMGRYDFFKNESIKKIVESLNILSAHKVIVEFHLIGYGDFSYSTEINVLQEIASFKMIQYGKKSEQEILQLISDNGFDAFIAMGSSAYFFAALGLPVIAIDSAVKGYGRLVKCCWLADAADEFDEGSSLYLDLIGQKTAFRSDLLDMFRQIMLDKTQLELHAKRCLDYVRKFHSPSVILPKIQGYMHKAEFQQRIVYEPANVLPQSFTYLTKTLQTSVRIAVFGTGVGARRWLRLVNCHNERNPEAMQIEIVRYFDNNAARQGQTYFAIPICAFAAEYCIDLDFIVLASDYWVEMQEQILAAGISRDKIYRIY